MLSSIVPLSPKPAVSLLHNPHFSVSLRPFSKSHICFAFSPSNGDPIGEESRWLREEQRWLREEQRWLKEESRWNAERQALLQEINGLKLRIQELERLNSLQGASVTETVANIAKLLQVLKEGDLAKTVNRIAESGSSAVPLEVETSKKDEEKAEAEAEAETEVVIKEMISVPEIKVTVKGRETLRMGSEGDQVREMQEALQKLGFYSGEEDMEFSSFSTGTERAVKTWQSTVGAREDGIMTADLLERLFGGSIQELKPTDSEKSMNGAPIASITKISKVEQTVVTDEEVTEVDVSHHRVFLLGENRWEEPSRLSGNGKRNITKSTEGSSVKKCLTCRGEGRVLCMECDGTGEPNVEPQFLEWVDEGAKCPYCEGLGYNICDICEGATVIKA